MTRKIKRNRNFELVLEIGKADFIAPPRNAQRNWILNRAMSEWAEELEHLNEASRHIVAGRDPAPDIETGRDWSQAILDDQQIMEDWQIPVMEAMAGAAAGTRGDVLEIGFGRGVSASFIQDIGVRTHTIVECNDAIVRRLEGWRQSYPGSDIRVLHGLWQDLREEFTQYDGIFFHAYPLTGEEFIDEVINTTTFAGSFFPVAAEHLRDGGVFTYLSNEADSISRMHQRLLLAHFSSFAMESVGPLAIPEDTLDSLWGTSMVVIRAFK